MEKIKVNPYRSIATSEKQLLDAGKNKNVMNDKKIKEIFDKKTVQKIQNQRMKFHRRVIHRQHRRQAWNI